MENLNNKTALKNAGFQEAANNQLIIKKHNTVIYINPKDLHAEVYVDGLSFPTIIKKLNDLEDVKAFCYGHIGCYLDFTAKPKYDWKTVESKIGGRCKLHLGYIINTLNAGTDEGVLSKEEAQSMIAKLKLNIIIQQINKDYPKDKNKGFGYISYTSDKIMYSDSCVLKNALGINTESPEGAKILLDQNPQLLQNLFKIETDATTD